ncbi:MAG: phosphoribosylformylglycinamidine synthase [Candidatus Tokpelaia sp. JSC161]|jgi:phosphoribosylformylglycinamidine synthase|nr:MAG: phosphoribosylformylglycinamidine synthase [Candidatus Tokpelaia sp. JSC161]
MIDCKNNEILQKIIRMHGLQRDEYIKIINLIGRTPTLTEIGIFSAMWNEHCSYKSSKKWLRMLPTKGKHILQGPGENAGIIDIGRGECLIFKIESHNHPSYIEPYQGAATGVGGILRDIFTMGARPIATMNSLRFGATDHPLTRHLVTNVVAGIGDYSNAFGVPNIGGEINFDPKYNNNILVNTFAAGITRIENIFYSKTKEKTLEVAYLGAKTGRDGIGGASMASTEFDNENEKKRPTIQVGDPFSGKCLLEACLEVMANNLVSAIQDMGAAGLTCSSVEIAAKSNLGIEIDLDKVPVREQNMTDYEIMLSESQERMLMLLKPEQAKKAKKIFQKWGLEFSIIGKTTDNPQLHIFHKNKEIANLPIQALTHEAPEYDRPWIEPEKKTQIESDSVEEVKELDKALIKIINSPNQSSRRWVYEQYDTFIQGNTIINPGGDAGVIRINNNEKRALAFSADVTPRYCQADPYEGAKQAVAECWRNITTSGATPIAATDNLNFGNPEKPEIMGQLVLSIKGISHACSALNFPIVSGNVSLYNETNGTPICPTPVIVGVGIIENWEKIPKIENMKNKDSLLLIGGDGTHLGQSIYLREILGKNDGTPPPVDLIREKHHGNFIRKQIESGSIHACHDISDGGLILALAEMGIKSGYGATIKLGSGPRHAELFGEDQGRYILSVHSMSVDSIIKKAKKENIPVRYLGTAGGAYLFVEECFKIEIKKIALLYENWFPHYMQT